LQALSQLGAASGAPPPKQLPGAFEGLLELLASVGRCARRRCRLDGDGRALREDAIKIRAPNPDPPADADRRKRSLVDPIPQGLGIELEVLGDLVDREVLVIPARAHAN
jgi:hypothetical protein